MPAIISLKEALQFIDKHDYRDGNGSFKIAFMLTNRTELTGGDIIILENACRMGLPPNCKDHEMRGIKDMDTGKPYAVHNRLMFSLNDQEIYWI